MLFALICTDKPNSVDLRMSVRPDHVKYLESLGAGLKAAGPFTTDDGSPTGSLVIIEAETRAAAQAIAADDPYAKAGLFASVEIKAWKWSLKNPEAK
ncbi:YciI-like protein [Aestuariivirga sp.]|uniref:YciI-like protein n=1 Tax=Aestuariivirga sp. TaxID=2650926 RepID=UPI003BA94441